MLSESSKSVDSYEQEEFVISRQTRYLTTNLITSSNLTLADIQISKVTKSEI